MHGMKIMGLAAAAALFVAPGAFAAPADTSSSTQSATADALGAAPMSQSDLGDTSAGSNTVNGSNSDINSNNAANSYNATNSYNPTTLTVGSVTDQTLAATDTGNSICGGCGSLSLSNGSITIGANAFSGFNGVGNFVMNTGNQNTVQGSLNVTIVMPPAAP